MDGKLRFTKMHGLGNDYIYVNVMEERVDCPENLAVRISSRHTGIGSDGLVLIGRSEVADFSMRIFNADGSEAYMCGNASRCVGRYLYEKGYSASKEINLETLAGIRKLSLTTDSNDSNVISVTVDMGIPAIGGHVSLSDYFNEEVKFSYNEALSISMGNPHLVIFPGEGPGLLPERFGSFIEKLPVFPDGTNVEFAVPGEEGRIRMRVWERGSGVTLACGTGACATAVAARYSGFGDGPYEIVMDGGSLKVAFSDDGHVLMSGPAEFVFEGEMII